MGSNGVKCWVVFSRTLIIGRTRVSLMGGYFGSLEKSWHAGSGELAVAGLDQRLVKSVLYRCTTVYTSVDTERMARLEIKGVVKQVDGMNYIRTCEASVEYQVS